MHLIISHLISSHLITSPRITSHHITSTHMAPKTYYRITSHSRPTKCRRSTLSLDNINCDRSIWTGKICCASHGISMSPFSSSFEMCLIPVQVLAKPNQIKPEQNRAGHGHVSYHTIPYHTIRLTFLATNTRRSTDRSQLCSTITLPSRRAM